LQKTAENTVFFRQNKAKNVVFLKFFGQKMALFARF